MIRKTRRECVREGQGQQVLQRPNPTDATRPPNPAPPAAPDPVLAEAATRLVSLLFLHLLLS